MAILSSIPEAQKYTSQIQKIQFMDQGRASLGLKAEFLPQKTRCKKYFKAQTSKINKS